MDRADALCRCSRPPCSACRAIPRFAVVGNNAFALNYAAKDVTSTRTELGLRADRSFAAAGGLLTLRGRAAWAHDYNPDRTVGAVFQTLPGSAFVVNGARAGARFRADHGVGPDELDERLVRVGDLRGRVLERHALLRRQGRRALRLVGSTASGCVGLRGGRGAAAGAGVPLILLAASLTSSSERRMSSRKPADFFFMVSASSCSPLIFSNSSSALPSTKPGTTPSILVTALSKPANALSTLA